MPPGKQNARMSRANGADEDNRTIAEKLALGSEVKELKMGRSFMNDKSVSFHTLRYDFKPASVDVSKDAAVAIEGNQKVTVTVPHVDGAGTPHTVYKGSYRPYQKECVLIIDRKTGKVTLEKLSSNLQLKKTRSESEGFNKRSSLLRAQQMASSLSTVIPRHSPLHPSPSHHSRSPTQTSNQATSSASSLPLIGLDEINDTVCLPAPIPSQQENMGQQSSLPSLSESSSSDSSPDQSDSEPETKPSMVHQSFHSGASNNINGQFSGFSKILNEDLQLSESGSDD